MGEVRDRVKCEVRHGDCRDLLKELADNSVDSVVTDPPYELTSGGSGGFMGRRWDATGVSFDVEVWREVLRVAKPGAHLIAFGGDRTIHRLMVAIEDAGFELRTMGFWVSAQSFPKNLDISKAIDMAAGAEREVIGTKLGLPGMARDGSNQGFRQWREAENRTDRPKPSIMITAPATDAAKKWEGWGTALKNQEPWVLARKPLCGTVADNILKWGVGGLYIDGCRIRVDGVDEIYAKNPHTVGGFGHAGATIYGGRGSGAPEYDPTKGRWPSAIICSDEDMDGPINGVAVIMDADADEGIGGVLGPYTKHFRIGDQDDQAIIHALPEELLMRILPTGVVCPKTGVGEREMGLEKFDENWVDPNRKEGSAGRNNPRAGAGRQTKRKNTHPTVKPISLMRHLVKMVTPPGGLVIDPFCGTGSTGVAAAWEGKEFIGMELTDTDEDPYVTIARARIAYARRVPVPEITHRMGKPKEESEGQLTMF